MCKTFASLLQYEREVKNATTASRDRRLPVFIIHKLVHALVLGLVHGYWQMKRPRVATVRSGSRCVTTAHGGGNFTLSQRAVLMPLYTDRDGGLTARWQGEHRLENTY